MEKVKRKPGRPIGHPKAGGRVKGTPNHATVEVKQLARVHGPAAIERLAEIAFGTIFNETEAVKTLSQMISDKVNTQDIARFARQTFASRPDITCVAAIKELLDRGYGRAPQPIDGDGEGGPIKWIVEWEK